jgi:integrase
LRRAREHLAGIRQRIAASTFSFAEEFPNFRNLKKGPNEGSPRTCAQVFDAFLAHCESREAKSDMAAITLTSYRKILNGIWRPRIGATRFLSVRYSTLVKITDEATWSKKIYNNATSVRRRAFKFGYRDHPENHDPTSGLKSARIRKKDRPVIDPYTIQEAESLIAAIHRDWGEAQGNYDEFRFFTGMRPSDQIALLVTEKTGEDRRIQLCPRTLKILRRQLALRTRLELAGKIHHDQLFFKRTGEPIRNLQYPYARWRRTLARTPQIRYRKPYCGRHSSVSWNLIIGRNPLWVAKQHGHSITTMLSVYAAWTEGSTEPDIRAIKRAMAPNPLACERAESPEHTALRPSATTPRLVAAPPSRYINAGSPSSIATGFATRHRQGRAKCSKRRLLGGGERGIRTGFRHLLSSASYGFRKQFGPRGSPENPLAVTGAVTGNASLRPVPANCGQWSYGNAVSEADIPAAGVQGR